MDITYLAIPRTVKSFQIDALLLNIFPIFWGNEVNTRFTE